MRVTKGGGRGVRTGGNKEISYICLSVCIRERVNTEL